LIKKKKLILSRDRFGEKPLYYIKKKDELIFGSEIKYIKKLNANKKLKINFEKITNYLQFGYKSIFKNNDSFFEDVYLLNSGSYMEIDKKMNIKIKRYWFPKTKIKKNLSLKKVLNKSKYLLKKSIELTLRSDVPVALCLSGGIDSNTIAAIAKKKF